MRRTIPRTAFRKGQSGNPGGRPKEIEGVRELARKHTEEAINTLVKMLRSRNDRVRVAAAEALLDRGWGRSNQDMEVSGSDSSDLQPLTILWNAPEPKWARKVTLCQQRCTPLNNSSNTPPIPQKK